MKNNILLLSHLKELWNASERPSKICAWLNKIVMKLKEIWKWEEMMTRKYEMFFQELKRKMKEKSYYSVDFMIFNKILIF